MEDVGYLKVKIEELLKERNISKNKICFDSADTENTVEPVYCKRRCTEAGCKSFMQNL